MVENKQGSYVVIYRAPAAFKADVGSLGALSGQGGYYAYIGSAFGLSGIAPRVERHKTKNTNQHWHIDYIKPHLDFEGLWYSYDQQKREHQWAFSMSRMKGVIVPFAHFGSSDCNCQSHLFYSCEPFDFEAFKQAVLTASPSHSKLYKE